MKIPDIITYILVAILGGLVKELNTEDTICKKRLFVNTTTSILIGITFGLLTEKITGDAKVAIAVTALAGVRGYDSLVFATNKLQKIIKKENFK